MNTKQKQIAMIAGGALVLILLYRWYQGRQTTAATGTATPATDTAASDYASLAGQEQGDVATLQNQNAGVLAQETGDVAGLGAGLAALSAIVQNLAPPDLTPIENQINALATGQAQMNRHLNQSVATHPGGGFYKYYKMVTGHAPPAHVLTSNFIYQAWKGGVKATALKPAAKHPTTKPHHQVAHPNPTHKAQTGSHKATTHNKAKPKTTAKTSGKRK